MLRRCYWLVLLCAGTGCCTNHHFVEVPAEELNFSYVTSVRSLPLFHSLQEIESRSWTSEQGEQVSLLRSRRFPGLPEGPDIYVAFFGSRETRAVECLDFYGFDATRLSRQYFLLCHDPDCPSVDTDVTVRCDGNQLTFQIDGENKSSGRRRLYWITLNTKWQMVRSMSEWVTIE